MRYRILGRTGMSVSEVGLGCEHLEGKPFSAVDAVIQAALNCGINVLDVFMPEPQVRSDIGRALRGRRKDVCIQGHIGAAWVDGQATRVRDIKRSRAAFDDLLQRLDTDWIDLGMIHFVDTEADWQAIFESETIDFVMDLKQRGVIRAVGLSSHHPVIARKAVETGLVDVLMFSVNPAFDLLPADIPLDSHFSPQAYDQHRRWELDSSRARLYASCEARQVGMTIMKGLAAGRLLRPELSPFGTPMSVHQCIHYGLQRPAAASVLVGCRTPEEVHEAAAYIDAPPAALDYAQLLESGRLHLRMDQCMYCNHCLPCPEAIDIAAVMKYIDLAEVGVLDRGTGTVPHTVAEHYRSLEQTAKDCSRCGACERRCPFGVPVMARMDEGIRLFSR